MAKKSGRIYWRKQGKTGERRAYADFRDFADVGGRQVALVPKGATSATSDPIVAEALAAELLACFQERRRNKTVLGIERQATLADFAAQHLVEKAKAGRVTDSWLGESEKRLRDAVEFFGADRDLASIAPQDVRRWAEWLGTRPGRRGNRGLSGGSLRHYLNTLSNLYRRAAAEGYVGPGFNPVAALVEKPVARREEARWLEVHEAALFLEAARTYQPKRGDLAIPFLYPLVATFLLTGGRESEVLGLEVGDVNFERNRITFRPNDWRRLKTRTSHRPVPLWPQLRDVLADHVAERRRAFGRLVFPSTRTEHEQPIADLRKALDGIAVEAGWKPGEIRTKMFRHTYCAARLQTVDRGHPVSPWTVAREMGHGGTALVERVYGHLGDVRHRSEEVEYRIEAHGEALRERAARRLIAA
jgi:integrase